MPTSANRSTGHARAHRARTPAHVVSLLSLIGLLNVAPAALAATPSSSSNVVAPWDVGLSLTVNSGFRDAYLDIDRNGQNDMFVRLTWEFDSYTATFRDTAMIGFLGAFQGNLSLSPDGNLARYEAGHQITDADFQSGRRDDGAFLWMATWDSNAAPGYLSGELPSYTGSFTYDQMFGAEAPTITAKPTERNWSIGAWQNVGDTGYAVFRQTIDGTARYGWVELTHGSIDVGMLGFTNVVAEVPEPGTAAMMLAGLAGLGLSARRRASGNKR